MKEYLSKLRKDYGRLGLSEADVHPDPIKQFELWFTDAANEGIIEPNAMCLSTVNESGEPSSRIVLLRNFNEQGFTWYTNYNSPKAKDLQTNNNASLNFFWPDIERQVRISGKVSKISMLESIEYFKSRPRASQIGAWASAQSEAIVSRAELDAKVKEIEEKFKNKEVEKPPFWGGFCLKPSKIEFWQGRPSRLHDRIQYLKKSDGSWTIQRLSP
jgi:pyridoxamine 5'-phosphate oxidase